MSYSNLAMNEFPEVTPSESSLSESDPRTVDLANTPSLPTEPELESAILKFGTEIFSAMGTEAPGAFSKNFWAAKIMQWSMAKQDLKVNMFRLVDVLPTLRTSAAIARHVQEYLSGPAADISSFAAWGLNRDPNSVAAKLGAKVVKIGIEQTAKQFIAGESPQKALSELRRLRRAGLAFTCDLLGEYCVSEREAKEYLARYLEALEVFGKEVPGWKESAPVINNHPGEKTPICISVKLTALYSQCSILNFERTVEILSSRLGEIVASAKKVGAQVYVDAEDTGNNPMVYAAFKQVFGSPENRDIPYPGIVVQAYAKEAEEIVYDLLDFAKARGSPIAVRLVKGAYYDHETVLAAQSGWPSPLFNKKTSSDANFERVSRILLDNCAHCMPAFGSHNIRSLAAACCYAESIGVKKTQFELQMLYGMAEPIARAFSKRGYLTRLYVPLGQLIPGMGYLVRRLLENTSNESFLKHTFFDSSAVSELLRKPTMEG